MQFSHRPKEPFSMRPNAAEISETTKRSFSSNVAFISCMKVSVPRSARCIGTFDNPPSACPPEGAIAFSSTALASIRARSSRASNSCRKCINCCCVIWIARFDFDGSSIVRLTWNQAKNVVAWAFKKWKVPVGGRYLLQKDIPRFQQTDSVLSFGQANRLSARFAQNRFDLRQPSCSLRSVNFDCHQNSPQSNFLVIIIRDFLFLATCQHGAKKPTDCRSS